MCSRLKRSDVCTLMVKSQHAGSLLQAYLVLETAPLSMLILYETRLSLDCQRFAVCDTSKWNSVWWERLQIVERREPNAASPSGCLFNFAPLAGTVCAGVPWNHHWPRR